MWTDMHSVIAETDEGLGNPETNMETSGPTVPCRPRSWRRKTLLPLNARISRVCLESQRLQRFSVL